jgi:hypothetical protein
VHAQAVEAGVFRVTVVAQNLQLDHPRWSRRFVLQKEGKSKTEKFIHATCMNARVWESEYDKTAGFPYNEY